MSLEVNTIPDLFWEAAKGKLPFEFFYFAAYVENPPKDQWVTVWPAATIYPWAETGTVNFVSTSAQDSLAGTGIQLLLVFGIDSATNDSISEVIAMNGTTPVTTVNSYGYVGSLAVQVGSVGSAVGTITGRTTGFPLGPIREIIQPGYTGIAAITGATGNGENSYIYDIGYSSTAMAEFRFQRRSIRDPSQIFEDIDNVVLDGGVYSKKFDRAPIKFPENSDGQMIVRSRSNNNIIRASYSSIRIREEFL